MPSSRTREIQAIVSGVDVLLRERLQSAGIEVDHAVVAILPGGGGVVRSNIPPSELGLMAIFLATVVTQSLEIPDADSLN